VKDHASPIPGIDGNLTIKELTLREDWIRWSEVLVLSLEKVLLPS